tara:strand:- start:350 stop:616 length:267 start_codon:yes stop_codon:yes gene_type:complete
MKKIITSIAALTVAASSYSQCIMSHEDSLKAVNHNYAKEMAMTTEDIIKSIRANDYSDTTKTKQLSEIYVHNLLDILSKLEDLQQNTY